MRTHLTASEFQISLVPGAGSTRAMLASSKRWSKRVNGEVRHFYDSQQGGNREGGLAKREVDEDSMIIKQEPCGTCIG